MPDQETAVHEPAAVETDEWIEHAVEELPPRPRRRLFGAGGNPIPPALLGVLLIACGFIGGVLVEKGQTSSNSSSGGGVAGLASRFAALRGASGTGSASGGASAAGGFAAGGSAAGGSAGGSADGSGAGGGATIGQVAYIDGSTLYVTNTEGNTVKVKTSAAATVTKTVKANVKGIRPGETVVITGATGTKGEVSAESIRVGGAGGSLGALFGGSGRGTSGGGRGGTGDGGPSGGGEPALFGKGG